MLSTAGGSWQAIGENRGHYGDGPSSSSPTELPLQTKAGAPVCVLHNRLTPLLPNFLQPPRADIGGLSSGDEGTKG